MSTTKPIYLKDLHFEHKLWDNQLNFAAEEIKIYEDRLEYLSTRNTDKDMLAKLEHFQNQFIRQKEVIDELKHKIKLHEQELAGFAEDNPIAIDHRHFQDHTGFRDEMNTFNKLFAELKQEFQQYSAEWM